MANEVRLTWEAADGYSGGRRPQTLRFNPRDFDITPATTDADIALAIEDSIEFDFQNKVRATYDIDALVALVRESL